MNPKPRIYISSPVDRNLRPDQQKLKRALLDLVRSADLDPQEFHVSGLPSNQAWSFKRSRDVMRRCHGAIVLGFAQWYDTHHNPPAIMPTESTHLEGALALSLDKQMLIIKEEEVAFKGINSMDGGEYILSIPAGAAESWLNSADFQTQFTAWKTAISNRHHVFFGYSSGATNTANRIIRYLHNIGVRVRDWQMDFRPAGTILDEIEEAAKTCLGGIFLFSTDDEILSGDTTHAAPRDNVVFEAGFFMHAVGRERSLIIRQESAKMPADVGGGIYLSLQDPQNTSTIETSLRQFIETRI